MSAVILPKGDRVYSPNATVASWVATYLNSSVGQKAVVAVTGLSLTGFLLGHLAGNLKMFGGRDSINAYAHFLKHDLGVFIWVARAGLLGLFVAHVALTIRLQWKANAARPVRYAVSRVAQATLASRTMLLTGLTVGAFTIFHLAHYTFGLVHDAVLEDGTRVNYLALMDEERRHDVYSMVIAGFRTWWISAIYIACQLILFLHLSHGIQSSLQTLGLVGRRFTRAAKALGYALAVTIVGGNIAIVVGVWTGFIPAVTRVVA